MRRLFIHLALIISIGAIVGCQSQPWHYTPATQSHDVGGMAASSNAD
jgi:hypothetical protein